MSRRLSDDFSESFHESVFQELMFHELIQSPDVQVMLFGSHPTDYYDRNLRITVAYNKFGPGLVQRMPR